MAERAPVEITTVLTDIQTVLNWPTLKFVYNEPNEPYPFPLHLSSLIMV